MRLEELHRKNVENGSNIFVVDKGYRSISPYKRFSYKRVMGIYDYSKAREKDKRRNVNKVKQGLVKLTKEQFVERFKRDRLNKIKQKG